MSDLLVAAGLGRRHVHRLGLPALGLGEALVHLVQVAGEDRRLVAARRSADLDDDVLLIGGIGRDQHELDVLFQLGQARLDARDLLLGELLHIGIGEHLLGRGEIVLGGHELARLLDQGPLIGVFLRQAVVFLLVGEDGRIAHLRLKLVVGIDDLLELLAHVGLLHSSGTHPYLSATSYRFRAQSSAARFRNFQVYQTTQATRRGARQPARRTRRRRKRP